MIPLRRQLIVKEHGNLLYPEGTACADVLIAGDKGGSFASRVFAGLGLGALYTLFQNENMFKVWPSTPTYTPKWYPGSSIQANTTSEYLGVGYIIGPRIAGVIFAGGVCAWLVVMPAIKFFGSHVAGAIFPGTMPIADMGPGDLYRAYIRPMGGWADHSLAYHSYYCQCTARGRKRSSQGRCSRSQPSPYRSRPQFKVGTDWLRRAPAAHVGSAHLQAHSPRRNFSR
jgi:hypothetical protein